MTTVHIDEDFVAVYSGKSKKSKRKVTLAFGDALEVREFEDGWTRVRVLEYFDKPFLGWVKGRPKTRDSGVLRLSMVDVQQGDGLVLETPEGKIAFIDGGDNKLFARHVAARYRHRASSAESPLEIDAMIVTHGDADHFDGLNEIRRSESFRGGKARKSLFIHPKRVFHNGLVKSSGKVDGVRIPDLKRFGKTVKRDEDHLIVDLYDDPRDAPPRAQNKPFKDWARSLDHWETRGPIEFRRVAHGMDPDSLFDFLKEEGIEVDIQGPFTRDVESAAGGEVPALPFLHRPKKSALMHLEDGEDDDGSPSASHTINGHSIALRIRYGNVRINLTGDLNDEAMDIMRGNLPARQLEAEIVKAPHHGSHDFDFWALEKMKPVVAIVSSGDEKVSKEHIHPRATLMAALGKVMRGNTGVVFCTELAAFFAIKDYCYTRKSLAAFFKKHADRSFSGEELRKLFSGVPRAENPPGMFFGFERKNFGIVHMRTDGERVLVYTHSGKAHHNEAYRFSVTRQGSQRRIRFRKKLETR